MVLIVVLIKNTIVNKFEFLTCWMGPPAECDHCTETADNSSAAVDRQTKTGMRPKPEILIII